MGKAMLCLNRDPSRGWLQCSSYWRLAHRVTSPRVSRYWGHGSPGLRISRTTDPLGYDPQVHGPPGSLISKVTSLRAEGTEGHRSWPMAHASLYSHLSGQKTSPVVTNGFVATGPKGSKALPRGDGSASN